MEILLCKSCGVVDSGAMMPELICFVLQGDFEFEFDFVLPSREMILGLLKVTWKTIQWILPTSET